MESHSTLAPVRTFGHRHELRTTLKRISTVAPKIAKGVVLVTNSYLLLRNAGKRLDRCCKAVPAVAELVAVRNRYVHPKAKAGPIIREAINNGSHRILNLALAPQAGASANSATTANVEVMSISR